MTLKQCKHCCKLKVCALKHTYGTDNVYANENGSLWRGATCPECFSGTKTKLKRELTTRKCRVCKCNLPKSRYFNCIECVYKEELDHDATGYNAVGEIYI